MPSTTFDESKAAYRNHLPDLSIPRFQVAKEQNAYEYADAFKENHQPPWLYNLTQAWQQLYQEPYKGLTSDGNVIPGLFERQDEGVPIQAIVDAFHPLLAKLTPDQKAKVTYPLNAREWRAWSNPEFLLRAFGLRLDDLDEPLVDAILTILKTTFSPEGYAKALAAMRINHFLGELCQVPKIMNQYSYNFLIFGTPSTTEPFGFLLYGHHLCLSTFLYGPQIIISPWFTGAEPNIIDQGPWAGTEILHEEGHVGLQLMQSLSPELQKQAQIYSQLRDPGMKQTGDLVTDRWNRDDQRHLCGAFRDNRIVPYEGILATSLSPSQLTLLTSILNQYLLYLPQPSRSLFLKKIESHFPSTYFCWIGGFGDDDPFYFRIQSPVVVVEFDHHSGVFLNNEEPAKFHTHTLLRMPNRGDYGAALRGEGQGPQ